ncbi:holin [Streptomyces scopuliridis]|uniref:holin n=1 Tax=Streptomyces scopuliridis TaxID=452529 RepID=UPI003677BEC1
MIEAMAERLVAEGCDSFQTRPGPVWNESHRRSYAAYQIKCGNHGAAADGIPGQETWAKPRVPRQAGAVDSTPGNHDEEKPGTVPQALADVAERTVATFVQTLLGLMAAGVTTDLVSLTARQAASVAAIPAGLSALKSTIGMVVGRSGTASWLPAKHDPATPVG